MTACAPGAPSLDICPTQDQVTQQLIALLPRGRAWGTHDGGPFPGSVLYGFWSAVAAPFAYLNQRICDLRREFFCATQVETTDQWLYDYGLPDACEPFPDLCEKVKAQGGSTCDYLTAACAAQGWSVACEVIQGCGARAGGTTALAGLAFAGAGVPNSTLVLAVDLDQSPAFKGRGRTPPLAGLLLAGQTAACPYDLSPLACLIARIAPAHLAISFDPFYALTDDDVAEVLLTAL